MYNLYIELFIYNSIIKPFSNPFIETVKCQKNMYKENNSGKAFAHALGDCVYFYLVQYSGVLVYNILR